MSEGRAAAFTPGEAGAPNAVRKAPDPALRRFLAWAVFLITGGYIFLDYWNYSRTFHEGGGAEWDALLAGRGFAPAQYRIGVLGVAELLARVTHSHLRHAFAAIDCICLGISLVLLLRLLMQSDAFRRAERMGQWLQGSLALGCGLSYLLWSFWYQKPETHATLLLLVLSAAVARWQQRVLAALALIVLAAAGATVRADAVVAFHAGFLAVCLLAQGRSLPLGRTAQAVASALSIVAAVAVEYLIVHRIYPHAPRQVAAVQLAGNLTSWIDYVALAFALFPWWITLGLAMRRWRLLNGWSAALLLGSVVHFALFYTFGIAWEVRIFLPFAMTLVPVTVTLAYEAIDRSGAAEYSR